MSERSASKAQGLDLIVLAMIGGGLLLVLLAIIAGLFGWFKARANVPLPNWAENVLVSISTACALKLGDVLATLVALATGRQVEAFGQKLASSSPTDAAPAPKDAVEAAGQTADAARAEADDIADRAASGT